MHIHHKAVSREKDVPYNPGRDNVKWSCGIILGVKAGYYDNAKRYENSRKYSGLDKDLAYKAGKHEKLFHYPLNQTKTPIFLMLSC